jgi:hypothetical protein
MTDTLYHRSRLDATRRGAVCELTLIENWLNAGAPNN